MKPASLTRSGDFRRAYADGRRSRRDGIRVAVLDRADGGPTRVGFSVRSSAGSAVTRNRIKRRLRAGVAHLELGPGLDAVVSAEASAATLDFQILVERLKVALRCAGVGV